MKKLSFLIVIIYFSCVNIYSQDKVLLEIQDEKITVEEFLHIYTKNNKNKDALNYEAMKEYMDLFIDFKLKVYEAKSLGLDTTQSFINELKGYRTQLAQPYLTDKKVEQELVKEAYERMKYDINVSHILVSVDPMAEPADTLEAYNRLMDIYKRIQDGEDFEELALKYSQDESVQNNNGNLGYRTVFGLVYPFETVMYNTPVGEISKPVRTNFGYHLIKVNDKREARGRYKVAHIMLMTPPDAGYTLRQQAKTQIHEIHEKLNEGADFAELAQKYSQDRRTAQNDGELGWVSVGGRMVQVFENYVFELEEVGQISEPVQTNFGWHIIKVLDIEPIKPFEKVKREIISKISNTARASKSKDSLIASLIDEYNPTIENDKLKLFYEIVTDSIFHGTWKIDEDIDLSESILTIKDVEYTKEDFYKYIKRENRRQKPQPIKSFVDSRFKSFVDNKILEFEESRLEYKYPEFKYLLKEYHDGILLFELTDKMVWSRAINDTAGLENFYENNKENYMWDIRYEMKMFECVDDRTASRLERRLERNRNWERLNRRDENAVILSMHGTYEENVNSELDRILSQHNIPEEPGFTKVINLDNMKVAKIKVIEPMPKAINEARGIITADFQNYLEKEWVQKLRDKYDYKIHKDVLRSVSN